MKVHHAIGDGLGVMIMLSTLQDNYSPNQWIQTTEVLNGFMAWLLYVFKPLTLIYAFLWFFFWKIDKNIININLNLWRQKHVKKINKRKMMEHII